MEYKYTGIVLGKRDVGETDRIYSLYTLEGGKIQALAKGVRKPQAKLAGSLENFTLADVTVMKARGMGKITGSIVEKNHVLLKGDYDALVNVMQSMHVFNRLVDLEHYDAKVFLLLEEYLAAANKIVAEEKSEKEKVRIGILLRLSFLFKLLNILGYSLVLAHCACCGKKLSPEKLHFSCEQGGVLCHDCRSLARQSMPLSANALKLMRLFLHDGFDILPKLKLSAQDLAHAQRALQDFLLWI